jgi:ribosomal protein S27AE
MFLSTTICNLKRNGKMKLNQNTLGMAIAGCLGLSIGTMVAQPQPWLAASAGVVSGAAGFSLSKRLCRKRREALESELSKARADLVSLKSLVKGYTRELEQIAPLKLEIAKLNKAGAIAQDNYQMLCRRLTDTQQALETALKSRTNVQQAYQTCQDSLSLTKRDVEGLKAEIADMEERYEESLKVEAQAAAEGLRDAIELEIRLKALEEKKELVAVYQQLDNLFKVLADRNTQLSSAYESDTAVLSSEISGLANLVEGFDEYKAAKESEYLERIHQIESQLNRDYQEPIYLDAVFNPSLQAANGVIKMLYQDFGVAVEALGGVVSDSGDVHFGVLPGRSQKGEELARLINQQGKNFAQSLKLGVAPKAVYQPQFRSVEVSFRRDTKPVLPTPPRFVRTDFAAFVLEITKPNVPGMRIMGESGSGKSSVVRLILSEHTKNHPSVIKLHDPQSDTDEDRWEIEKTSSDAVSTGKALKKLGEEVEAKVKLIDREIHVFDELDGLCKSNPEAKKALLTIAKKARHIKGLWAIFLGQSSNVGRMGLEWSDMGNFAAVYLQDSAIGAIEKYPRLESQKAKLKGQFDEISAWCETKNKEQHIESHEPFAHRFALVVIPGKEAYWLLLPVFSEGISGYHSGLNFTLVPVAEDATEAQLEKSETSVSQAVAPRLAPTVGGGREAATLATPAKKCPKCGEGNLLSRGKDWRCTSCNKSTRKAGVV